MEISAVATLLFRYFYSIFSAEKVKAVVFSKSHGFDLFNLRAKSSLSHFGERNSKTELIQESNHLTNCQVIRLQYYDDQADNFSAI